MSCQFHGYLYRLAHTRGVHLMHVVTGIIGVLGVRSFASRRMLLLWLLLLVRKLALHAFMGTAIHLASVRDSS